MVYNVWTNDIKEEIIINAFKKTGITVKEDGSEDELCLDNISEKVDDEDIIDDFKAQMKRKKKKMIMILNQIIK